MKYDVPFEKIKSAVSGEFSFFEKLKIQQEGKRLYKLHPKYDYLKEDPWLKEEGDFYKSVTYAYMVDQILKNNPEHTEEYKNQVEKFIKGWSNGTKDINTKAAQAYSETLFIGIRIIFVNKQIQVVSNVNAKKRKKNFKNPSLSMQLWQKWMKNAILMSSVHTASPRTLKRSAP